MGFNYELVHSDIKAEHCPRRLKNNQLKFMITDAEAETGLDMVERLSTY